MSSRTVLFGGTFDPVHDAHLEISQAAASRFDLRSVLFIPAANPPHKGAGAYAPYEDRVRMLELACSDEPRFEVSLIEAPPDDNPEKRNYTIDTIESLRSRGSGALSFLIGADAFREIASWHRWQDVVKLVEFIVVTRPGAAYDIPEGATVHELGGLHSPISSSDIRRRLAAGDYNVPVPQAVIRYIRERALYR